MAVAICLASIALFAVIFVALQVYIQIKKLMYLAILKSLQAYIEEIFSKLH